jgi:hypothetical protein
MPLPRAHTAAALLAIAPWLSLAPAVSAQYIGPGVAAARTQAAVSTTLPAPQPFIYNPWGFGNNVVDPYGGYMQGAASIINAQANFTQARQQAAILKEQARQARLDTQRRIFDEWLYEQANTPTWEQMQERARQERVQRSLFGPDPNEIASGWALNELLTDIQRLQAVTGLRGPHVPLDPEAVAHINFSAAGSNLGGVGMFRGGKIPWPGVFLDPRFDRDRAEVERLLAEAIRFAQTGSGSPTAANDLDRAVQALRARLREAVDDIPAADYITALEFFRNLDSSVQALRQPTGGRLLSGELTARGNTVDQLVDSMTRQGLRFAPAVPGYEGAYSAIWQALRTYDLALAGMAGQVAQRPPSR